LQTKLVNREQKDFIKIEKKREILCIVVIWKISLKLQSKVKKKVRLYLIQQ